MSNGATGAFRRTIHESIPTPSASSSMRVTTYTPGGPTMPNAAQPTGPAGMTKPPASTGMGAPNGPPAGFVARLWTANAIAPPDPQPMGIAPALPAPDSPPS